MTRLSRAANLVPQAPEVSPMQRLASGSGIDAEQASFGSWPRGASRKSPLLGKEREGVEGLALSVSWLEIPAPHYVTPKLFKGPRLAPKPKVSLLPNTENLRHHGR